MKAPAYQFLVCKLAEILLVDYFLMNSIDILLVSLNEPDIETFLYSLLIPSSIEPQEGKEHLQGFVNSSLGVL